MEVTGVCFRDNENHVLESMSLHTRSNERDVGFGLLRLSG